MTPYASLSLPFRALAKRHKAFVFESALLPRCELSFSQPLPALNSRQIKRFHHVVKWPSENLHPCFLHTQAFAQHMQIMLRPEFPFAVLGLVHKSNFVQQYQQLDAAITGTLSSHVQSFRRHAKGISFVIGSQLENNSEILWRSESEFLALNRDVKGAKSSGKLGHTSEINGLAQQWHCDRGLGRRYARAAGDFNPIHLSAPSAKLFGFKQAIAHGMWTKARCLSQLHDKFSATMACRVTFKQPIYLPSEVTFFQHQPNHTSLTFVVSNQQGSSLHLQGEMFFEACPPTG